MAFAAAAAHDARLPGNRPPCSSRERAFAPDAGSDTAAVWRRGLRRRPFLACHRLSNIARGPVPDLAAWQPLLSAAAQRPDHRLGSGSAFGSCGTRARACEGVLVSCGPGRARMQTLSAACWSTAFSPRGFGRPLRGGRWWDCGCNAVMLGVGRACYCGTGCAEVATSLQAA